MKKYLYEYKRKNSCFLNSFLGFVFFVFFLLLHSCSADYDEFPDQLDSWELNDDYYISFKNTALNVDLFDNDNFKGNVDITIDFPKNGKLTPFDNNKFEYSPSSNFIGIDSLVYKICISDSCKSATAYFYMLSATPDFNKKQLAKNDVFHIPANKISKINILANDNVPQPVYIKIVSKPYFGKISFTNHNTINYEPNQDFTGKANFSYELINQQGQKSYASVEVNTYNTSNEICNNPNVLTDTIRAYSPYSQYNIEKGTYIYYIDVLHNDKICNISTAEIELVTLPESAIATVSENRVILTSNVYPLKTEKFKYKVCFQFDGQLICKEAEIIILQ